MLFLILDIVSDPFQSALGYRKRSKPFLPIEFANNNLSGRANFLADYRNSKTRVCVTAGMMTTGYDCTDILNLAIMRPIFSPTEFIQIKGRGARKHDFSQQFIDPFLKDYKRNDLIWFPVLSSLLSWGSANSKKELDI